MRKIWFLGGLVLVLIVITGAYIRLVFLMSENRPIYDALPGSSTIVFEFKQLNKSLDKLTTSSFSKHLQQAGFVSKLQNQLAQVGNVINPDKDSTFNYWEDAQLLAAFNMIEQDAFDYLYIIKKKGFSEEQFNALFVGESAKIKSRKRIFREIKLFEIHISDGNYLTCSYINGILMASFTSMLVEEAVVQMMDKPSLLKNKGFKEVNGLASEDADVVIYLNCANLNLLQPLLVNNNSISYFNALVEFGGWMELDLKINNSSILINGYTKAGDEKNTFLSAFSHEPSSEIEATKIIPNNVALFFYHGVESFEKYVETKGGKTNKKQVSLINNFRNWVGNEWCFGILEPFDKNFEQELFLAVKVIDQEIATASLLEIDRLNNDEETSFLFNGYQIGRVEGLNQLGDLFNHELLKLESPYYTIIDNYVVFANSLSAMKIIISQYAERQTIIQNPDFIAFEKNLTRTSNFYVYVNTARIVEILKRLLSKSMVKKIRDGDKDFIKFGPLALQFNHYEKIFFTSGYLQYSSQIEESSNRIWQTKLDANVAIAPSFVTNHYTNDKEIFIQDSLYNIYLITKSGKILWKRKIDGLIMSDIQLIDFYENTKLQYVFNTRKKIYIIDRKGEDVANYPIKLPAEASNGLLLVNYNDKKNYRIFVACKNKNIYGFYRSGKPLPGWSPQKGVGVVKHPIKHSFVDGKDYLIATNDEGKVHYYNRRGQKRTGSIKTDKSFVSDFHLRKLNDNTFQMFNVDNEGNVYKVYRNGSFSKQKHDVPTNFFDFQLTDLNGDNKYEFIFVDTAVVQVYDEKYAELFTLSYPKNIDQPAFVINYADGLNGLGLISKKDGKIYLIDENYQFLSVFPLDGNSQFVADDLFGTGRKIVIAGGEGGFLNAYQVK